MTEIQECSNCGNVSCNKGEVYKVFWLPLILTLGFPATLKLCDTCASNINLIGFYCTLVTSIVALIYIFTN
jgi:hypothetical protein